MTFAEDLKRYMSANDLNQTEMGELVGVSQPTISRWLIGRDEPVHKYKVRLAEIDDRVFGKYLRSNLAANNPLRVKPIPVVGIAQAGLFKDALEWGEEERYEVFVPMRYVGGARTFGLEVRGDSMNLMLPAGSVVICRPFAESRMPMPGDVVLAYRMQNGQYEATLKEIEQDESGRYWLWPRSTNPNHQTPFPIDSEEIEVAALVTWTMRPVGKNPP